MIPRHSEIFGGGILMALGVLILDSELKRRPRFIRDKESLFSFVKYFHPGWV